MARKLTDEELSEPDVTLIIPNDKWAQLPQEVKDYLNFYIDRGNDSCSKYTVPAYLVREFEAIARRLEDKQS